MDEEQYFKERLDDQISWYDKKSISCQNRFKWIKRFETCLSLTISLFGGYACISVTIPCSSIEIGIGPFVAIFGAVLSFLHFMQSLEKYHENWIAYRQTCELLKHEKYLFLTNSGGYKSSKNPFNELVERCESIISSENIDWAQLHSKQNTPNL